MNIIVLLKMVPDMVEELEIDSSGTSLDTEFLRMNISEPDDHALEQALLLKEKYGGKITLLSLDSPEIDDILFTALAKGADRMIKVPGEWIGIRAPEIAKIISVILKTDTELNSKWPDSLILTGSQAIDDLEGEVAPYLSEILGLPYLGVITGIGFEEEQKKLVVTKEFSGGLRGEYEIPFPAILGIQAAEKPPRYVPVAKVRQMMKSAKIEEIPVPIPVEREIPQPGVGVTVADGGTEFHDGLQINQLFKPDVTGKAEILEGTPEDISSRIVAILTEKGLL